MTSDSRLNTESWLRQQSGVIQDLFETSASALQANGIRLLVGSAAPKIDDLECCKKITLLPLRFMDSKDDELLSLSMLATAKGGPPRYAVILLVSGALTCQALYRLVIKHASVWDKAYLKTGLWIGEGVNTKPLNHLSQITESGKSKLTITGVFLHSDLGSTIQRGVMTIGLLYRSILDELSGASKMDRLYAQLENGLDNRAASFQRMVSP